MSLLEQQLENNSLSTAYIFEGKNNDYNLDYSLDFIKNVFSKNNIDLDLSVNPDFYMINKGNDIIDIDTIRSMLKDISLKPSNQRIKVYLIHNAHNMRVEGFNAILKTIEELKDYNLVIITTTNSNLLLPTIRSRCQIINLSNDEFISKIDLEKLSDIVSNVYQGKIESFYQNKSFFESLKDEKNDLIDAFIILFSDILDLKYNLNIDISDNYAFNINKLSEMSVDKLDDIINSLYEIKQGFKNNINYDLAIEKIIFNIYKGGAKDWK